MLNMISISIKKQMDNNRSIKYRDKLYKDLKSHPPNSTEYNSIKINLRTYNNIGYYANQSIMLKQIIIDHALTPSKIT